MPDNIVSSVAGLYKDNVSSVISTGVEAILFNTKACFCGLYGTIASCVVIVTADHVVRELTDESGHGFNIGSRSVSQI